MANLDLKLIHPENKQVVAEVHENEVVFHSPEMEENLKVFGVAIPEYLQKKYEGKQTIFPKDDQFVEAFVEVHYPYCLREMGFLWGNGKTENLS